jgi:hypothetical protein
MWAVIVDVVSSWEFRFLLIGERIKCLVCVDQKQYPWATQ